MDIERTQGEGAAKHAKQQLYGILRAADDNMIKKIKQVVDRVADKVSDLLKIKPVKHKNVK